MFRFKPEKSALIEALDAVTGRTPRSLMESAQPPTPGQISDEWERSSSSLDSVSVMVSFFMEGEFKFSLEIPPFVRSWIVKNPLKSDYVDIYKPRWFRIRSGLTVRHEMEMHYETTVHRSLV